MAPGCGEISRLAWGGSCSGEGAPSGNLHLKEMNGKLAVSRSQHTRRTVCPRGRAEENRSRFQNTRKRNCNHSGSVGKGI